MTKITATMTDFMMYFNVADEIWPMPGAMFQATLNDIDGHAIKRSYAASEALGLPWPPYLPAAEEYALDHPEAR